MQIVPFCYFHCRLGYKYQFHHKWVDCAFCFEPHLWLESQRSENKRGYFRMPFHLLCRRKCQTCFSFAMGCVKPWFKHPECNISNTSEGTEIRAYLGGCVVHCVEVDLNSVGASQEKPQSICKSYQCRTDSCVALWSREAELSQSHSSISFFPSSSL